MVELKKTNRLVPICPRLGRPVRGIDGILYSGSGRQDVLGLPACFILRDLSPRGQRPDFSLQVQRGGAPTRTEAWEFSGTPSLVRPALFEASGGGNRGLIANVWMNAGYGPQIRRHEVTGRARRPCGDDLPTAPAHSRPSAPAGPAPRRGEGIFQQLGKRIRDGGPCYW